MGRALFPDPQWDRLAGLWDAFYPTDGLTPGARDIHRRLEMAIPEFVDLLIRHRPASLRGRALGEVMQLEDRQPHRLAALYRTWIAAARAAPPGQADDGVRGHRPGPGRRPDQPGTGGPGAGQPAHVLGPA